MREARPQMAPLTAPPPTGEARGPGNDAPGQHQPNLGARGNEVKKIKNAFELLNNTNNLKGMREARPQMAPLTTPPPRIYGAQHYTVNLAKNRLELFNKRNFKIPRLNQQGPAQHTHQVPGQQDRQDAPQGNGPYRDQQGQEAELAMQEGLGREDRHQPPQEGQGDGGHG